MPKIYLRRFKRDGEIAQLQYFCPGCGFIHGVSPTMHKWNGNVDSPTFTPSLLLTYPDQEKGRYTCHSFMTNGKMDFLDDCTHSLRGQKGVEVPEFPEKFKSNDD